MSATAPQRRAHRPRPRHRFQPAPRGARRLIAAAAILAALAGAADAHAGERVALVPLASLADDATRGNAPLEKALEQGLTAVPEVEVIGPADITRTLRKARRRDLAACEGAPACLAELGGLLGATKVIYGEVGGLGDAQVVYLEVVDVPTKKQLRSTTLELDPNEPDPAAATRAAAYRLLAPDRYRGRLALTVDVKGASIYVNGQLRGTSPTDPVDLPVGTHALRVTHPEFHDFVRFIDVDFDQTHQLPVELRQYPIVSKGVRQHPVATPTTNPALADGPTPWYRRWYTVAGGATAILVTGLVVGALLADGIDADSEKVVNPR